MIVAVSVDIEGPSQLRGVREIWGCLPEYWETGKPRLEADVFAALAPFVPTGSAADQERVAQLRLIFDAWAQESQPQWWEERADPLPPEVAQALAAR